MRVVFALFPGCELLDVAGPLQVFHEANLCGGRYELVNAGVSGAVFSGQGLNVGELAPLPEAAARDLVMVPGYDVERVRPPQALIAWLREAAAAGATICGVCTGAFVLGHANLLNGRCCTTHWKRVDQLQKRFPKARVAKDRLFIDEGAIVTSAGAASGIDVALWLVERDFGPIVAGKVAREMVVYVRREGNHAQESPYLDHRAHLDSSVHRVQDYLIAHPSEKNRLTELAAVAGMSRRTLTRAFREATGLTVAEYRERLRLEAAKQLLERSNATVERVANEVGFDDPRQLRRAFRRHFGVAPSAARR